MLAWIGGLMPRGPTSTIIMKTNAGLGVLASGLALVLIAGGRRHPRRRRVAQVCAAVALLLGLATLSEHVAGWNLGIDELLATEFPGAPATASPNRMGPPASLSLALLGAALLLLTRRARADRRAAPHEPFALAAALLGLLAIIGYLYGADELYDIARLTGIAWPTALSILLLAVGVLHAEPDQGLIARVTAPDPGGGIIRGLLGAVVLLPLVLGWVRLTGERLGWFDAPMGTGLIMLLFIVTFSSLLLFAGRRVSAASAALGASEREARSQKDLLAVTLASIGDAVIVTGEDGAVTFLNGEAERLTGWTNADAAGKPLTRVFTIVNQETRESIENAVEKVMRPDRTSGLGNHTVLVSKDGREIPIDHSGAPIQSGDGEARGVVLVFRDITERRRADEERQRLAVVAQQERDRLSALINSMTDEIWFADADKHLTLVNPAVWKEFGASLGDTRDVETIAARFEVYRADGTQRPVEEAPPLRALRGEVVTGEDEIVRTPATGEMRYRQVNAAPVRDHDGAIVGSVSVVRDITDRKRAEQELRHNEQRLALAASATGIGIFDSNLGTGEIAANEQFGYLLGLCATTAGAATTATTLSHRYHEDQWAQRVHPDDWRALKAAIDACRSKRHPLDAECRVVSLGGTERWVNVRGVLKDDDHGNATRLLGVLLDISQRKKAEAERDADVAALTRMQRLSRRGVEAGGIAALLQETIDTAVAIMHADKGTLQLLEGDTLRIVAHHGHEQPFLDHFAAAENVASVCGDATRRAERVIVPDVEISAIFSGTPSLPVMRAAGVRAVQSTPLLTRGGRLLGILTTQWAAPHTPDEHRLWRLDLLARQAADLIEQKQADRELREANAALAESSRRKDEFIAILSHELRNPLAPIRYALPALEKAGLTDAGGEAIDVIERQVTHLTRLVDDLLDVSRITTGKIELRRDYMTLRSVVGAAVEGAAPAVATAGHSLKVQIPDEPLWVYGDAARLSQVVTNLLDNSAKYTPSGGQLEVTVSANGGRAAICVRDNGGGIPPNELPTVFEMFHQVNRAKQVQEGLGIGLALVKRLVEMHGGTVEAHSAGVGRGAEFVVELPLAAKLEPPSASVTSLSTARKRLRVLVVDDNADLVTMLAVFVESLGHDVRKAFDGPSALSAAVSYRPDVVLLDLGLPGMSGLDVARELRRRPETSGVRLIALTGWGQTDDRQATRTAGFDAHLTKPTDPDALGVVLNCERRNCADCVDRCPAAAGLPSPATSHL